MASKLTFTPLSRNRYRCNQTSKVVKNPKKVALAHAKSQQNIALQLKNSATKANVVTIKGTFVPSAPTPESYSRPRFHYW